MFICASFMIYNGVGIWLNCNLPKSKPKICGNIIHESGEVRPGYPF